MFHASQLQFLIDQATDSVLYEPNISLNLEIVDLINSKGKGSSREAATAISKRINGTSKQSANLALTLLDYCVKNCGYPFHLVISSKSFLNEFVRRFPDRPRNVGPIQQRILELLQIWNATLCVTSRHKDDFRHINDMYRLLSFKGYVFPTLSLDPVMNPIESLKTEEELEKEDKIAQGTKLEELLRLGTPSALAEANDLMKVMSGYDLKRQPDYHAEFNQELTKVRFKATQLYEVVSNKKPGDRWERDPLMEELHANVKTAQSKIQNLLEKDTNEERLAQLFELNDLFNSVLANVEAFKRGDPVGTLDIPIVSNSPQKSIISSDLVAIPPEVGAINLIDFDDSPTTSTPIPTSNMMELLSNPAHLIPDSSGVHSFQNNPSQNLLDDLFGLGIINPKTSAAPADTTIRPSVFPTTLDIEQPILNGLSMDDAFDSFLSGPQPVASGTVINKEVVVFNKNGLQIHFKIERKNNLYSMKAKYLNTTPVPFTDFIFQVAVPKSMTLEMNPLSSSTLEPLNQSQATQSMMVTNTSIEPPKIRFKLHYSVNGAVVDEAGEYVFPI